MEDEAVIERLTEVRGIGGWTVEMLLIFRLGRPDVLPADDYGIRKGFALTFKKPDLPARRDLEARGARWKPSPAPPRARDTSSPPCGHPSLGR